MSFPDGTSDFNADDVRATYRFLAHVGHGVTELRVIAPGRRGILGIGYFDNEENFVDACRTYNGQGNIYAGINPRPARFLEAAHNRVQPLPSGATDKDIESITAIVLDLDPVRPKDTAATDEELALAVAQGTALAERLEDKGFQRPVRNMSGNGCQVWIATPPLKVARAEFDAVTFKLKAFEKRQRQLFTTSLVKIDSIFNLSRIIKVIGTISVKGDDTPDRPHRLSRSLDPFVRREDEKLLEAILAIRLESDSPQSTSTKAEPLTIAKTLSMRVQALLDADNQVAALFEGRGKPAFGPDGKRMDTTSSGYDFSLALKLARKGITEPSEIGTAIWHRPDGAARAKGKPYVAATVAKALKQAASFADGETGTKDCIDFTVTRVVIRSSDPPFYHLSIGGKTLVLTAEQLLSPQLFARRFLEMLHRVPRMPGKGCRPWSSHVNAWLARAEVQSQPVEASERGLVKLEIASLIDDLGEASAPEDLDRGKVLVDGDRRGFKTRPLRSLLKDRGYEVQANTLCDVLRDLGCQYDRPWFGGKRVRVWLTPVSWPDVDDGDGSGEPAGPAGLGEAEEESSGRAREGE